MELAAGPVATLVQLYILELHGTVIDVGLAVTLFNAVGIPASIIWGYATDRFQSRRSIIVLSSAVLSGDLLLLPFAKTIYAASFIYAVFSLISSASATPINLLIMETQPKSSWATAFARLSMVSTIGETLGLVLGAVWSSYLPVPLLALPLAAASLVSAILSLAMIRNPPFFFEEEIIALERPSLQSRLLALPIVFLRVPALVDFKAVFKGLRNSLTMEIPLLYLSILAFYFASGLFNTSLIPSLNAAGLSGAQIFVVSTTGIVFLMISFHFVGRRVEGRDLTKSAVSGLILRSICYAIIGLFAVLFTGFAYFVGVIILYPLASGLAFALYYTSSSAMVFNAIGEKNRGSRLGVYSALVGAGTTVGSLISGYLSFYAGFIVTFALATAGLLVCAYLISKIRLAAKA